MNLPYPVNIEDFDYSLPEEKIALFPVSPRDLSKLLVGKQDGSVVEDIFHNIVNYLPDSGIMVFNETRVIHARMIFYKPSGGRIEIFCLGPADKNEDIQCSLARSSPVIWKAMVGNARRWKETSLSKVIRFNDGEEGVLRAWQVGREGQTFSIRFDWEPKGRSFAEVMEAAGKLPLPPYIQRETMPEDEHSYQTIFAKMDGSVAAPTAGLHFTDNVLRNVINKNISLAKVVLHVGAGTFKPVENSDVSRHRMHEEQYLVNKKLIKQLLDELHKPKIVVGTTTVRTLESLYEVGKKLLAGKPLSDAVHIHQWDPYQGENPTIAQSLNAILEALDFHNIQTLTGTTRLMIVPGYQYKFADLLITNFHQPRSTLLLLVAAFYGKNWRKAYEYALGNDFRFLSYGDACLFFKQNVKS